MERQAANALAVAKALEGHLLVEEVINMYVILMVFLTLMATLFKSLLMG
jgi:hypothetical protein